MVAYGPAPIARHAHTAARAVVDPTTLSRGPARTCTVPPMNENTCERLMPLADVPDLPWLPRRRGKRLHIATLYRWAGRGCGGRRLRTMRVGGVLCTSEEALREFFANEGGDAS